MKTYDKQNPCEEQTYVEYKETQFAKIIKLAEELDRVIRVSSLKVEDKRDIRATIKISL